MIALFTDFGVADSYVGQVHARLRTAAPDVSIIDLFHGVTPFNVCAAAYLLPAYAGALPVGTVFLCVIDPGVGSDRRALYLEADGRWFVGPDNGLFTLVVRYAQASRAWEILWRPESMSSTFHGRDLFAPVAAELALGRRPEAREIRVDPRPDWPDDLPEVIHVDRYGNAVTGMRAATISRQTLLQLDEGGPTIASADCYAQRNAGDLFWYANANGLVEIAATRDSAAARHALAVGTRITCL
ncbi:MAG: SAM hydrolase/SAM-dependent halogenase family protein [Acidiferrobacteraceae bacterium]